MCRRVEGRLQPQAEAEQEKNYEFKSMEDVWEYAIDEFKKNSTPQRTKKQIEIKNGNARKVKNNEYYYDFCKICNQEVRLSCNYNGNYPLCYIHRDPNERLELKNKSKNDK